MLLYLHGFNSSPNSAKAQQTLAYLRQHCAEVPYAMPQLANTPAEAVAQILPIAESAAAVGEPLRIIGSSMGGFLATYLIETLQPKYPDTLMSAVLINPAVTPWVLKPLLIGEHHNPYTDQHFTLTAEQIDQLHQYHIERLRYPAAYRVLLQAGDEVLDYRLALAHYQLCQLHIEPNGDHSFIGFEQQLPAAFAFLDLA
ncbi:YqiA/YcfP family alpha/beta fold hydrolase [Ferrimonas senticii]|uniref:YqiA/YcfP family alpha/beta fold hydrolase n=1 Tax=Ferrimonas senticii TaxID=394566 RepID=UPI0003F7A10C|nr:YqiA/YcfP family alpha/beta fold hydrolase [Ferrimonas senticii]